MLQNDGFDGPLPRHRSLVVVPVQATRTREQKLSRALDITLIAGSLTLVLMAAGFAYTSGTPRLPRELAVCTATMPRC